MKEKVMKGTNFKRLLSLFFVLTMLLTVIPVGSASAGSVTSFSFNYAYDCSRSPAFPKVGDTFNASRLKNPLVAFEQSGTTTKGNWKLTSKGLFTGNDSDYENANYCEWCEGMELKTVVDNVASTYGMTAEKVEVFELTESDNHISYGVICALNDNVAAFIGDTWDGGGGYVLSVEELSDPYVTTITMDLTTGFVDNSLEDAKEEAKKAIGAVADPYSADIIVKAAERAKNNVDAQTTLDGVAKAREDGIKAVKDAIYKHELDNAKQDATMYLNFYAGAKPSTAVQKILDEEIEKIYKAKTVEEVGKIEKAAEKKIDKQKKVDATIQLNAGLNVTTSARGVIAKWGKVSGVDGYMVYAAYCGQKMKVVKTITKASTTSFAIKGLSGKKNVKVYVAAYKLVNGKKVRYCRSITAHAVGYNNKTYTNAKSVTVKKTAVTLKAKKSTVISATLVKANSKKKFIRPSHMNAFRYASSDTSVATVSASGKITAKAKGTCTVYVYAQNGRSKKITVKVN